MGVEGGKHSHDGRILQFVPAGFLQTSPPTTVILLTKSGFITGRQILYDSTFMRHLEQLIYLKRKQNGGFQGLGEGIGEFMFSGHRDSVWEDEKVLEMDGGDSCVM